MQINGLVRATFQIVAPFNFALRLINSMHHFMKEVLELEFGLWLTFLNN